MVDQPLATVRAARVPGPDGGVYRVAKWPEPFALPQPAPPLADADRDPEVPGGPHPLIDGNRFDDADGHRPGIYVSSSAEGAFGETLARFRERPQAWKLLATALAGTADPGEPELDRGIVPPDWPHARNVSFGYVTRKVRFVDLDNSDAHVEIAREMRHLLTKYRLPDIDRGVVLGRDRRITRLIASYFGHQADKSPTLTGLRYESRLRSDWECWLIWSPLPFVQRTISTLPVTWSNPDLRSAAHKLRLQLPAE